MKLILSLFIVVIFFGCNPFVTKHDTKDYFATLPDEEAIHPKNSLEWWYITGFLEDENGKEYGIEYVIFHFRPTDNRQRLMVNVAITTPEDSSFVYDYEIVKLKDNAKDSLPLDFNLENFQWKGLMGNYELNTRFLDNTKGFDLTTKKTEPVILHQGKGYATYGDIASAGYYSIPRLKTNGNLYIDGDTLAVSGELWYDRQWNCGAVTAKNVSWDWTAISFDNNTELMLFRVIKGNNKDIVYGGTFVDAQNNTINLEHEDIQIETKEYWKSPKTKNSYPMRWDIQIDIIGLECSMQSRLNNQELILKNWAQKTVYWEGMCEVEGTFKNQHIEGKAYLEMKTK
jgi:predicted secreted hydrolase